MGVWADKILPPPQQIHALLVHAFLHWIPATSAMTGTVRDNIAALLFVHWFTAGLVLRTALLLA
jgi:hypothetical protein